MTFKNVMMMDLNYNIVKTSSRRFYECRFYRTTKSTVFMKRKRAETTMADKMERDRDVTCRLKEVRLAKGVSQTLLAEWTGVKRQAIYDMESGRYLPNTGIALKLARCLGCRVEDLFVEKAEPPDHPVVLAEHPDGASSRVNLARIRGRLVAYPLKGRHALHDGFRSADGLLRPGHADARILCGGEILDNTVVLLGCDPAFAILREHAARLAPEIRVLWRFASSYRSVEEVAAGQAHLAGTHLHDGGSGESNASLVRRVTKGDRMLLVGFSGFEEGLMVASGNPLGIRGVADLAGRRVRLVNREPGAALRILLDDLLAKAGIPPESVAGYHSEISGHVEGAHLVAGGVADAALGLRAIALAFGLEFVSLEAARCDLVIPQDLVDHPPVRILLDLAAGRPFREELASLAGYDVSRVGDIVARVGN